jgi:membrane-bound metal-dependent hydrolase YbcI (DUF457 family)
MTVMNKKAHAAISGVTVASLLAYLRYCDPQIRLPHPVLGGAVAAMTASSPDWLEPATSPNHRQFFHSVSFASAVVLALQQTYEWTPKTPMGQLTRDVLLCVELAYLIHLGVDATTAKSIPWLGKFDQPNTSSTVLI